MSNVKVQSSNEAQKSKIFGIKLFIIDLIPPWREILKFEIYRLFQQWLMSGE